MRNNRRPAHRRAFCFHGAATRGDPAFAIFTRHIA
jgi:hypothetical protein